jgi:hypothetical protein
VNPETRLADIFAALEAVGLSCLIMGGHAVRFYGLDRNTGDFDLHLAPEGWDDLPHRLSQAPLFAGQPLIEGPSWRPNAFRRFQIGTLPSGREEWLEFWRENHLLAPFAELFARREQGGYSGRTLPFLSLPDLIRKRKRSGRQTGKTSRSSKSFTMPVCSPRPQPGKRRLSLPFHNSGVGAASRVFSNRDG